MYNGHIKYLNTEYLALVIVSIIFPYNDLDNTYSTNEGNYNGSLV